jgi:hydrogenase maturation protease
MWGLYRELLQQLWRIEHIRALRELEGGWNFVKPTFFHNQEVGELRTLVLGLGNPICADDGVGISIAEAIRGRVHGPDVEVAETSAAGLGLLDLMSGYQRLIVIDAIQTRDGKPGDIHRLGLEDLPAPLHCSTIHDVDLTTALELGRRLNMTVPREVVIYAVEVSDVTTFREGCTPEVERAIPQVADMVIRELLGPS